MNMTDTSRVADADTVQLMIGCQSRLYAFILSLLCDPEHAREVLQETNIVLWKKSDQFEPGTNFMAWAFRIARFQVMAHRQRLGRDRHVFDDDAVAGIAATFEERSDVFDDKLTALSHCLNELPEDGRRLIDSRYNDGVPVKTLAEQQNQSANRVAVKLHRLRVALMHCIEKRLFKGELA